VLPTTALPTFKPADREKLQKKGMSTALQIGLRSKTEAASIALQEIIKSSDDVLIFGFYNCGNIYFRGQRQKVLYRHQRCTTCRGYSKFYILFDST
jgi:spore coat polysaccharide biosynthesis protein SpsF (cytidylyltransferase family)